MVTEDYVSFEIARLLKEKGFDWEVKSFWDLTTQSKSKIICTKNTPVNYNKEWQVFSLPMSAPTLQMAMKWLREVHNQIIVPGISLDDRTSGTINHYNVGIWYIPKNNGGAFCYTSPTPYNGYPSFEEACEAGIKYCLENLI